MKKELKFVLSIVFVMAIAGFVSASYSISNYSIDKQYSLNSNLKGWINVSFTGESADSIFRSNTGSEISLINLLNSYPQYDFNCNPFSCEKNYAASSGAGTKSFSLNPGSSALYGLKIIGNFLRMDTFQMTIDSNAGASCNNQLKIDFFNDGVYEIKNSDAAGELCSGDKLKGCFVSPSKNYSLDTTPFCQRVKLPEAPGFKIGAWVKEKTAGTSKIKMQLFHKNGGGLGSDAICELSGITSSGSEVSCDIDYFVEQQDDYYVCIYAEAGTGEYEIQANDAPATACGFYGQPGSSSEEISAYNIFAQSKKFIALGEATIDNLLPGGASLPVLISNYISENYGNDCAQGCVIPIKFTSGKTQTVTLSGLSAKVVTSNGPFFETNFYDIASSVPTINSGFGKLNLDGGNFSVGSSYGEETIVLTYNGAEIFSEEVTIEKSASINGMSPLTTGAEVETDFVAYATKGEANITSFTWDFGNGDKTSTVGSTANYAYNATGNYNLKVTVFDSDNLNSSRTFNIEVVTPKEAANSSLKEKLADLETVKNDLTAFGGLAKSELEKVLDIAGIEAALKSVQQDYAIASDADYIGIMKDLNAIDVPKSIQKTTSSQFITFFPPENEIDLDILVEIAGKDYNSSKKNAYVDSLLGWNANNMDNQIKFGVYSAEYKGGLVPLLRVFDLKAKKLTNPTYSIYLVIKQLDDLELADYYGETLKEDYRFIRITDTEKTYSFSTTEAIDFTTLPVFVSPGIEQLTIVGGITIYEEPKFPFATFILILIVLIILAVVAYFALQVWYSRKYEGHLFKNQNDLYNILGYIHKAKAKGLSDKDTTDNLKKSGWKTEQITYALKKYSGKTRKAFKIPLIGKKKIANAGKPSGMDRPRRVRIRK